MAFGRVQVILAVIMMGGSPGDEGAPGRLPGDLIEMIITTAEGRIGCSPHHDDWEGEIEISHNYRGRSGKYMSN